MNYYDIFLTTTSSSPAEEHKTQMQEAVNEEFINSSSYWEDVYEEVEFGTLEFKKINARVTKLIDSNTGDRISDDFRKITFQDLTYAPPIGSRYKFDNNVWICYYTDNIKSTTSSIYLRRCNNTMNTLDKFGRIHKEPCYVEYKPTKSSITEKEALSIPYNTQILCYQINQWTRHFTINNRFIFGKFAYKISDMASFNRLETFNEDSLTMARCYINWDGLNEYDRLYDEEGNFVGVADYKLPEWEVCVPSALNLVQGTTGIIPFVIKLNGELVPTYAEYETDKPLVAVHHYTNPTRLILEDDSEVQGAIWVSSDPSIVSINQTTGEYECLRVGEVTITCYFKENPLYKAICRINVVETEDEIYATNFSNDFNYITLDETKSCEVFEYLNEEKLPTTFSFQFSGVDTNCYTATCTPNSYTIAELKQDDNNLLKVTVTNNRNNAVVEKYIELGGLF